MHIVKTESGLNYPGPDLDATDKKISEAMMGLWAEFARTGKPQAPKGPDWPPYASTNDSFLYISDTPEIKTGYSKLTN